MFLKEVLSMWRGEEEERLQKERCCERRACCKKWGVIKVVSQGGVPGL